MYLTVSIIIAAGFTGCSHLGETAQLPFACASDQFVETKLFFGRNISGGNVVTDKAWEKFAMEKIATRFPDGFTIVDANGVWKDCTPINGTCEQSKILIVAHNGSNDSHAKLESIASSYVEQFSQYSVLRTDGPICFSLIKPALKISES